MPYDKFLPEAVPAWQKPFWDGLLSRKILVQRCSACGKLRHTPKEICSHCHSAEMSWVEIAPTGEIYTFTVVHRAPTSAYQAEAPYIIAHVMMGAGVRMVGMLKNTDPNRVAIGTHVQADFESATPEWTLLQFK